MDFWPVMRCLFIAVGIITMSWILFFFLPRRGRIYKYHNWMFWKGILAIGMILASFAAGFTAMFYVEERYPLPDADYTLVGYSVMIVGVILTITVMNIILRPIIEETDWLRDHYPAVAKAAKLYQGKREVHQKYFPVLRIGEQKYFLLMYWPTYKRYRILIIPIPYHDADPESKAYRYLFIKENGEVVSDLELAKKLYRMAMLAFQSVNPNAQEAKAWEYREWKMADYDLEQFYKLLHEHQDQFQDLGPALFQDFQLILQLEDLAKQYPSAAREELTLITEWAVTHGKVKLTEISYDQLAALEKKIQGLYHPLTIDPALALRASQAAARLAAALTENRFWISREELLEGFERLSAIFLKIKDAGNYQIIPFTERDVQAFQDGLAWVAGEGGLIA